MTYALILVFEEAAFSMLVGNDVHGVEGARLAGRQHRRWAA